LACTRREAASRASYYAVASPKSAPAFRHDAAHVFRALADKNQHVRAGDGSEGHAPHIDANFGYSVYAATV
jgi:hypothetical protein